MSKCIYCGDEIELIENKKYCEQCLDNMYKECIRCHLPYDSEQYFSLNEKRCNSCQKKYENEKSKKEEKKLNSAKNFHNISDSEVEDNEEEKKNISKKYKDTEEEKKAISKKYAVIEKNKVIVESNDSSEEEEIKEMVKNYENKIKKPILTRQKRINLNNIKEDNPKKPKNTIVKNKCFKKLAAKKNTQKANESESALNTFIAYIPIVAEKN